MLAVVAALQRAGDFSSAQKDLTILVPPYDPADIFLPSYTDAPSVRSSDATEGIDAAPPTGWAAVPPCTGSLSTMPSLIGMPDLVFTA